ncbi:MAG: hypothetical protein Ta2A_10390 [Treponemataceae bacterium]|nr:MAG: hypothetical protein Ta2A_10390 [Treponemataceae bacterium]
MADQQQIMASIRIGTDEMDKDISNADAKIDKMTKSLTEKGKKSGAGFASGLKQGFDEGGKNAEKFGKKLTSSLGLVGLVLAAVTVAINIVKDAFGKAAAGNEKAAQSFKNIGNIIQTVVQPVITGLGNVIAWVADKVQFLLEKFSGTRGITAETAALAVATQDATAAQKDLGATFETSLEEIANLERLGAATVEESNAKRLSAYQQQIEALNQLRVETAAKTGGDSAATAEIDAQIKKTCYTIGGIQNKYRSDKRQSKSAERRHR